MIPGYDPFATAGDCKFDHGRAADAICFFHEVLTHVEGELAKKPFFLEPWEQAIVANTFGWVRPDGTRRYREVFVFVPRKNGKTALCAGIINYVLFCDDEPGAQIYCAAAERDQASLVYNQSKGMIENEPEMMKRVQIYKAMRSIVRHDNGSVFKVLTADADTKHGFNTHLAIVDELHTQPNADLFDVLLTSTGARRQPIVISITTSDFDRPSLCNQKHEYASKVRDGIISDQYFLPVIYEAAKTDDWHSEETWHKANPNLGVSLSLDYMRAMHQKAVNEPTFENTFKRLHLNMRTEQDVRWVPMDCWDACGESFDPAMLEGKVCYAGLDLSSTTDLTTLELYFPETHHVLCFFWIPSDRAHQRERRDRVPYVTWANQGFIEMTPGDIVDYAYVRRRLNEIGKKYQVRKIGYDPYNATQVALQLLHEDGLPMVEFRQGFISMNEPCKNVEALVIAKRLRHGGNPVLRWNASNVVARTDAAGNIKIDKAHSHEKVDGMVGLAMAVGLAIVDHENHGSVYDQRGILSL